MKAANDEWAEVRESTANFLRADQMGCSPKAVEIDNRLKAQQP